MKKKTKKNKEIKIIVDKPTTNIGLVHPFKDILPDVDEFFQSDSKVGVINTVNALCYKIKLLADKAYWLKG